MKPVPKATELLAKPSANFAEKLAATQALLKQAAAQWQPLKQASSLGAEDVVITHLINQLSLDIPVFVLETGALHHETLALLERLQANSRADIQPGQQAIYDSMSHRKACCGIRKLEPLGRALSGQRAWITGLRREQSQARAEVAAQESDKTNGEPIVKFNPLVEWTWGDVWHYIAQNQVDYNPLHDHFFPSIGCAPCTRAISLGEDFRAGRWWWESSDLKECGLHVKPTH
jgi:phosphoadenosine phosphosulfate reductase